MTLFKLLKCTVAPICCSCFCNKQLKKNVKCGKEYFTLKVSNIVLVIFKSFITFCWEKKRIKKKSHIESQSQYLGKKSQLHYFPKSFSPTDRRNRRVAQTHAKYVPAAALCQVEPGPVGFRRIHVFHHIVLGLRHAHPRRQHGVPP